MGRRIWTRTALKASLGRWNPHLPAQSETYRPSAAVKKLEVKEEKRLERFRELDRGVWSAFEDVVCLAEARSELVLGRVVVKAGTKPGEIQ